MSRVVTIALVAWLTLLSIAVFTPRAEVAPSASEQAAQAAAVKVEERFNLLCSDALERRRNAEQAMIPSNAGMLSIQTQHIQAAEADINRYCAKRD